MTVTLYKLGGSLLRSAEFLPRLNALLDHVPERSLFVIGGGDTVDLVRRWDEQFQLGEETAHHFALQGMTLNAELLVRICPRLMLCESKAQSELIWKDGAFPLLQVHRLLQREFASHSHRESRFPLTWETTADSLSLWLAQCWPVEELVLVKSLSIPENTTPAAAARRGEIDPVFPQLLLQLEMLRVSWTNFLDDPTCKMLFYESAERTS